MRTGVIIMLVVLGLILAGCAAEGPVADNETADEGPVAAPQDEGVTETPAADEPVTAEDGQERAVLEPETPEPLPPPTELDIERLDLELDRLVIYRTDFGEDEKYEMGMLLATDKHARLEAAELHFYPDCYEDVTMLITVNDLIVFNKGLACGEENALAFDVGLLQAGKNMITLHNHLEKGYVLKDIVLVFTYKDGVVEPLPAEDFFFRASDDEEEAYKTIGDVTLTNQVTQTFNIKEGDLTQDLYLELDAAGREGTLIVLLNGYQVFSGELDREDNRIELPLRYLIVGKNTLTFAGTAE